MELFVVLILLLTDQLLSLMNLYHCGLKFYVNFRVWYDEPKGDEGAAVEGSALSSSDIVENPAAKGVSVKGIGQR